MFDPNSTYGGAGRRSLLDFTDDQDTPSEDTDGGVYDAHIIQEAAPADRRGSARLEALNRLRADMSADERDGSEEASAIADAGETAVAGAGRKTGAISGTDAPRAAARKPSNGALIDPVMMIATAWRYRLFVVFTSILGAAFGVMIALSTPHKYESVSQFVLDPRELRLTDTDFLPQSYSADAILALVDSQVQIVDSSPVLRAVVNDLKLDEDPEFNGTGSSAGIGFGGVMDFIRGLFSSAGGNGESNREFMALQALSRAVSVFRGDNTFIVYVDVRTEDPAKSALIANRVVNVYIANQRETQSALFERTTAALNRQLDELRKEVEAAERRVEQYKADNDLVDAGGALISDEQIIRLNQQLALLRSQKAEIQVKAESAAGLDVDSLLSGTSPEILQSSTISELRAEYASAKRISDTLTTSLGPRHPQRIAAEQSLSTVRSEISNELRRIVEASQTELRRIIQSEQQLASDLAILKSKQVATSGDLVRLRELEREANATSQIYESFLKRARETREQQNLNTSNIRVISDATPALQPIGPSRKIIAAGGMFAGFFIGLAITLLLGAYRSVTSGFSRAPATQPDSAAVLPQQVVAADVGEEDTATNIQWLPQTTREPQLAPLLPANDDDLESEADIGDEAGFQKAEEADAASAWHDGNDPAGVDEYDEFDAEAESIREDIRQMREVIERLQEARRRAGSGGGDYGSN